MYQKITIGLLVFFLLSSCTVQVKKLFNEGKYAESLDLILEKLDAMPRHSKLIMMLEDAYARANREDNDSIIALKKTGKPDIWPEVFRLYKRLDERQQKVSSLPINIREGIGYEKVNYEPDLEASKLKAIQYYYTHAKSLIEAGGQENGRKAYYELLQVARFHKNYKDTEKLMRHALLLGEEHVLIKLVNRSGKIILPFFAKTLFDIELNPEQEDYVLYDLEPLPGRKYNYSILIVVDNIFLSPDRTTKGYAEYRADLGDGDISCNVTEIKRNKSSMVSGKLKYTDYRTNKVILEVPVRAKTTFEDLSYHVSGDVSACPEDVQEKFKVEARPFPSNDEMIKNVAAKLRDLVTHVIWSEEYLSK